MAWTEEDENRWEMQRKRLAELRDMGLPITVIEALGKLHLFVVLHNGWLYARPTNGIDAIPLVLTEKMREARLLDKRSKRRMAVPTKRGRQLAIDLFDDTLNYSRWVQWYREEWLV